MHIHVSCHLEEMEAVAPSTPALNDPTPCVISHTLLDFRSHTWLSQWTPPALIWTANIIQCLFIYSLYFAFILRRWFSGDQQSHSDWFPDKSHCLKTMKCTNWQFPVEVMITFKSDTRTRLTRLNSCGCVHVCICDHYRIKNKQTFLISFTWWLCQKAPSHNKCNIQNQQH